MRLDEAGAGPDDGRRLERDGPSLATRAASHVRWAKGWGGLAAFALVAYLSWRAGMSAFDAGARALGAGVVGFLAAWAASLYVCRVLVEAERRLEAGREREAARGGEADRAAEPFEAEPFEA